MRDTIKSDPPTKKKIAEECRKHNQPRYIYCAVYQDNGHRDIVCEGPLSQGDFKKLLAILTQEEGAPR